MNGKSKFYNLNNFLIVTIFFLALFLRIYYFDTELVLFNDENVYFNAGANLVEYGTLTSDRDGAINRGEKIAEPSSSIQPGYPLFIALINKIFGDNQEIVRLANILISMLSLFFIFKIAKLIGLRYPYIIIVLMLATLYPGFNFNTAKILTEHLFTLLLLGHTYYFVSYLKNEKVRNLIFSTLIISFAVFVRANAFPLLIMSILFLFIYQWKDIKKFLNKVIIVISIFVLIQLPWWIRNYSQFEKFILFSDAGDNPKVWGSLPYFIGIFEVDNQTLTELLNSSIRLDSILFYKWRIFGFFQYMWADVWDEYLVHPFQGLRPFLIIHLVIIVPTVILLPIIILRCKKEILFLSTIPLLFTIMNLPYHGLPRYVWPSLAIVFVLFGYLIQFINDKRDKSMVLIKSLETDLNNKIDLLFRRSYFIFSLIFSLILFFSVYSFSFSIEKEMSNFRLKKYANIDVEDIESMNKNFIEKYDLESSNVTIENVEEINQKNKFKNIVSDPTLIRVNNIPIMENSISEIKIKSKGGYIYDYMTVYWKTNSDLDFSESKVYRFPTNLFEKEQTILVEGDVSDLMIVPINFRGGTFTFNEIIISKYGGDI